MSSVCLMFVIGFHQMLSCAREPTVWKGQPLLVTRTWSSWWTRPDWSSGEARAAVHHGNTPRHRAFSVYLIDTAGHVLLTRRSLSKLTWPGVWSNSCCGHPRPGETDVAAIHRRVREELGVE